MDYEIDLDPVHHVLRVTITAPVVTEELYEDCSRSVALVASRGGPYACISDFSGVTGTTISAEMIRSYADRPPTVPAGRIRVVVAKDAAFFGLARMFQLWRDYMGGQFHVVHTMEEAYELVGVRPEDFTKRLYTTVKIDA